MSNKPGHRNPLVEFTAAGQVRPSPRAAKHLGQLGGIWRLVPEVGRVLLLERVDQEVAGDGRQVRLAGTFTSANELHNALSMIAMGQQDGALHVSNGECHKVFYFRKGVLLSASSSVPEDRLGNLMVRLGLLDSADRDRCLPEVSAGQPLGTVLVAKGIMKTPTVYEALRRQTEEIFYSILGWSSGAFYLISPLDMTVVPTMLHLNTNELLMDGVRRLDEEDRVASAQPILKRSVPVPAAQLSRGAVSQIVETYSDALSGLLGTLGPETSQRVRDEMRSFMGEGLPFRELFFGVEVANDGGLTTPALIANLGPDSTPESRRNVQIGLSELLFFAIFAAGEEVTPEVEQRIHEEVAGKLSQLPTAAEMDEQDDRSLEQREDELIDEIFDDATSVGSMDMFDEPGGDTVVRLPSSFENDDGFVLGRAGAAPSGEELEELSFDQEEEMVSLLGKPRPARGRLPGDHFARGRLANDDD